MHEALLGRNTWGGCLWKVNSSEGEKHDLCMAGVPDWARLSIKSHDDCIGMYVCMQAVVQEKRSCAHLEMTR